MRGACNNISGLSTSACLDFSKALELGNVKAQEAIAKICNKVK